MRKNRSYPTYVDRNIPVPEWAKVPFVWKGPPPVFVFPIGTAKSIAKHEWTCHFGELVPSEEAIKGFVLGFHWRWQGDHVHRYEVLVRWAYEFAAAARKARAASDTAMNEEMLDFELTELAFSDGLLDASPDALSDPQLSLPLRPGRPAPGKIKRSILLNPPSPAQRRWFKVRDR